MAKRVELIMDDFDERDDDMSWEDVKEYERRAKSFDAAYKHCMGLFGLIVRHDLGGAPHHLDQVYTAVQVAQDNLLLCIGESLPQGYRGRLSSLLRMALWEVGLYGEKVEEQEAVESGLQEATA